MFLKRIKPNKRILFNKYFIDPWSSIIMKKKFKNRTTQRFLQFFSRYLAKRFVRTYFPWNRWNKYNKFATRNNRRRRRWRRRRRESAGMQKFRALLATMKRARREAEAAKKKKRVSPRALAPIKKFILSSGRFYACYRAQSFNPLMRSWTNRFHLAANEFKRKWRFRPPFGKYHWLRRKKDYRITQLMDLVFQQYHYGFTSFASFKAYIRRYGGQQMGARGYDRLGVEGMLANQLCRTGFLINIRWGYLLVRAGGVEINGLKETNPRRMIKVGDTFRVLQPFSTLVTRHYLRLLRNGMAIFNAAPYLEFNLSLFVFKVWRAPLPRERRLINYFPFFKNELTNQAVKYFRWITE